MNDLNRHTITGNVGKDPQIGEGRAAFSVASTNRWRDEQGQQQERTTWTRVALFNGMAKLADNLKQGMRIFVEGPHESREYEKDGVKQRIDEIVLRGAPGDRLEWSVRAPKNEP